MNTLGRFALTLIAAAIAFAEASAQESKISSIVLYPGSATIERTARVEARAERVEITGLPSNFDSQSIRVSADAGIHVGEVSVKDVGRAQAVGTRQEEIEGKIQALEDQKALLDIDVQSAELVRNYLKGLGGSDEKSHSAAVDPRGLPGMVDTISRAGIDAFGRIRRAEIKKRELDKQIQALRRDLARIQSGARDARTIAISLNAEKAGDVRVSYQVSNAGWKPAYRAELASNSSTVTMERQAILAQATGEDWPNVKIRLSTTQPRRSPQGPEPYPWQLSVREPAIIANMIGGPVVTEAKPAAKPAPAPVAGAMARLPFAVEEFQTAFATEFEVPGRIDLPADGSQITVSLSKQSFTVKQLARIVPRSEASAIVTAEAERPDGVWLPGIIQLYRDGNLVGSTNWNSQSAEKLMLPFGKDDRIRVVVDRLKYRSGESGFLGSRVEREVSYLFTVTNMHKSAIDILVLESSPVSSSDKIEIKSTFEPKPKIENWEKRQGVVGWEQTIPAGTVMKLNADYVISYPKEVTVIGLP